MNRLKSKYTQYVVKPEGGGGGAIEGGYLVQFVVNGEPYCNISVLAGDAVQEPSAPTIAGALFDGWVTEEAGSQEVTFPFTPTKDTTLYARTSEVSSVLNRNSWNIISMVSQQGQAENYWSVGDCKEITLNGTVGTLALNNLTLCVFIIGFDHNGTVEGNGISFGCFKLPSDNEKDVLLCDSHYNTNSTSGEKWFNINHGGVTNSGGWKDCDMRYDILGSVEAKNQQNATSVAKTNPVANTLMAALPSDLRNVMKPITKWTDNVANGSSTASNVTATIDYLPLMAQFEIWPEYTADTKRNKYEEDHQATYAYYSAGRIKKFKHTDATVGCIYWNRSPYSSASGMFCITAASGWTDSWSRSLTSYGLAPVFLV